MEITASFIDRFKSYLLYVETFLLSNGKLIEEGLYRVPHDAAEEDEFNIRFDPENPMVPAEHLERIQNEDPVRSANLVKSFESFPWTEAIAAWLPPGASKAKIYSGSRRYLLSKVAGKKEILIRVAHNAAPEDVEILRDWHEIHPTKVKHSKFVENKRIYKRLKGKSPEQREIEIAKLKEKGLSAKEIETGERTFKRLVSFSEAHGEDPSARAKQWKAFETYDQICVGPFEKLRGMGEYSRVELLNKVAQKFLAKEVAHDDIKVTLDYLSEVEAGAPVLTALADGTINIDDKAELRGLTNDARAAQDGARPSVQLEAFHHRIFAKLSSNPDPDELKIVIERAQFAVSRYQALLSGFTKGA